MKKMVTLTSVVLALSACGGGGGDSAPSVNTAEGIWSGPVSTGYDVSLAVLENGEAWGVYSSGNVIYGALYGTATGSGTTFSASGTDFNFLTNTTSNGTFSGTVAQKNSINATSGGGATIALSYNSTYDTAASLASLAGTYSYDGRTGAYSVNPGMVTINSNGAFSLSDSGCTVTGQLTPRASGKNIYNSTMSFVGTCVFPTGTSTSGVAYLDTSVSPNRFISLALTSSKDDGLILLGTKQ